jgi:hypothetical protein
MGAPKHPEQVAKVCACCKIEKPAVEFSRGSVTWKRLHSYCRDCMRTKTREANQRKKAQDPLAHKEKQWENHIRKSFGLTAHEYYEMLMRQDGECAICGDHERGQRLAVDHCHETGEVRGLLCRPCNAALGAFRDSPDILECALEYLERTTRGRNDLDEAIASRN